MTLEQLRRSRRNSKREAFLYQLALSFLWNNDIRGPNLIDDLFAFGDNRLHLIPIRVKATCWEIPDWRLNQQERRFEREAQDEEVLQENRDSFEKEQDAIRAGNHLGWLGHCARMCEGHFRCDANRPRDRLIEFLGEENAHTAMEGLANLLKRPDLPSCAT